MRGGLYGLASVAALIVFALLMTANVQAAQYASSNLHYSIEIPSGWTQSSLSIPPSAGTQADVIFQSPDFLGNLGLIVTATRRDVSAKNSPDYVLALAKAERDSEVASGGGTLIITAEPSSHTYGNRPAAEFTGEITSIAAQLTFREVMFASGFYHLGYIIVFTARSDRFDSLGSTWNSVIDSFRVSGEPAPPGPFGDPVLLVGIIAAVVVATILVVVVVVTGRKRRMAATPPPYAPQAAMTLGVPPPPPVEQQPAVAPEPPTDQPSEDAPPRDHGEG